MLNIANFFFCIQRRETLLQQQLCKIFVSTFLLPFKYILKNIQWDRKFSSSCFLCCVFFFFFILRKAICVKSFLSFRLNWYDSYKRRTIGWAKKKKKILAEFTKIIILYLLANGGQGQKENEKRSRKEKANFVAAFKR